jgi:hypothetical protein
MADGPPISAHDIRPEQARTSDQHRQYGHHRSVTTASCTGNHAYLAHTELVMLHTPIHLVDTYVESSFTT